MISLQEYLNLNNEDNLLEELIDSNKYFMLFDTYHSDDRRFRDKYNEITLNTVRESIMNCTKYLKDNYIDKDKLKIGDIFVLKLEYLPNVFNAVCKLNKNGRKYSIIIITIMKNEDYKKKYETDIEIILKYEPKSKY